MKIFAIENHPNDSRVKVDCNGIVQTLSSRMGTGGGNVPFVLVARKEEMAATKLFPVECMSHDIFSTKFSMDQHADTLTRTDYKEPPVVAYAVDSHPTDSRIRIMHDDTCPTLTAHLAKVSADGPLILIKEKQ